MESVNKLDEVKTDVTCCFSGHRDLPLDEVSDIWIKLREAVKQCLDNGIYRFINGGARGFDLLAAEAVLELKLKYPFVELIMALPFKGFGEYKTINGEHRLLRDIIEKADEVLYISDVYSKGAMHERNRVMVDASSQLIGYCRRTTGGTAYTIKYAIKRNRKITLI